MKRESVMPQLLEPSHFSNSREDALTSRSEAQACLLETNPTTRTRGNCLDSSVPPQSDNCNNAGQLYRFERLSLSIVMKDMRFNKVDPKPGDNVPSFDLPIVGGGRFRSIDLTDTGPVLLVFGSSTCPVTDNAAPGLNELHKRFGDRIRFVIVNVREAHPGKAFPQPRTFEEKEANAKQICDIYGFRFEVAIDDIDGGLHRALGTKPNSAYILGANGIILFRAQWANDTKALEAALDATANGKLPLHPQSGGIVKPMMRMLRNIAPVLDRAGAGAWKDMWLVAPPLTAIALALKTLHVRPRS